MLNTINARAARVGDTVFAASRQLWLASLGASAVTRDWYEKEAGTVFRHLVREGTLIESRAMRVVGDRLDTSFTRANALWRKTRMTVTSTVKAYADGAVALAREIPGSLPKIALPATVTSKAPAKRAGRPRKTAKARTTGTARKTKRTVKASASA